KIESPGQLAWLIGLLIQTSSQIIIKGCGGIFSQPIDQFCAKNRVDHRISEESLVVALPKFGRLLSIKLGCVISYEVKVRNLQHLIIGKIEGQPRGHRQNRDRSGYARQ